MGRPSTSSAPRELRRTPPASQPTESRGAFFAEAVLADLGRAALGAALGAGFVCFGAGAAFALGGAFFALGAGGGGALGAFFLTVFLSFFGALFLPPFWARVPPLAIGTASERFTRGESDEWSNIRQTWRVTVLWQIRRRERR